MFPKTKRSKRKSLNKVERNDYLEQLVVEYKETKSLEAKQQVLANLANFAYDPVNYEFIRKHNIIDVFLDEVSKNESTLMKFGLAGLCNLALDLENKDYILHCNGVKVISCCLTSQDQDIVLTAITTLMFLVNPTSKAEITSEEIITQMVVLSQNPDKRIKNLAIIFLEDYCDKEQVAAITISPRKWICYDSKSNCDLVLQDGMEVQVTRKITAEDVAAFVKLTGDSNPIHEKIVHGALLNGLVSGVLGTRLPGPGTVVVAQEFQFPNPCYIGSNVNILVTLLNTRKIMTCQYTCVTESGNVVLKGVAKVILKK